MFDFRPPPPQKKQLTDSIETRPVGSSTEIKLHVSENLSAPRFFSCDEKMALWNSFLLRSLSQSFPPKDLRCSSHLFPLEAIDEDLKRNLT